jgi:superfamily I DNA and/or RNA helicase
MHPHIARLIECLQLEEQEQVRRYHLDAQHSLKRLKSEGVALHPIRITSKRFGWADYPELTFRLPYPPELHLFKDGSQIELFSGSEEPVRGILLSLQEREGEVRLFAPDYPDWIEDSSVAIKLSPDTRTTSLLISRIRALESHSKIFRLFNKIHGGSVDEYDPSASIQDTVFAGPFKNQNLNASQQEAIKKIVENQDLVVVHGPPGTGKTTTLTEAIVQLVQSQKKIIISAPSNAAVDHLALQLIKSKIRVLRVGNYGKANPQITAHTPEGILNDSKEMQEIKQLKKNAEAFRRMALKYKRQYGKAEREQRQLLFQEVKQIRQEIRKLQDYQLDKMFSDAQVIAGTPVGLLDSLKENQHYDMLFIDEAGQCPEPMAWSIFHLAEKIVLAGDPWQLPPTVISQEAENKGFSESILEKAIGKYGKLSFLNKQYRMRESIAGFSNAFFYGGKLKTPETRINTGIHIRFIDTAGSGFEEETGTDGLSLQNPGELKIILKLIEAENLTGHESAFISPYAAQIALAKQKLPANFEISTIDSFQGREKNTILLSLVRSNADGDIGFLKDYRRMNVAITRAQEQLILVGDSATLGNDRFYRELLAYIEQEGQYRTCWEFDLWDT